MTTFSDIVYHAGGVAAFGGVPLFTGKYYFVDPVYGNDGNRGTSPGRAFQTLYKAHDACTSGNNDVVVLIGNGAITGAAVLSTALAATVDSTATTGTLVWSKNATHLIGVGSPANNGRAKITTVYDRDGTTYTAATFGGAVNMMTVSGNGCYFANFSIGGPFSTGNASFVTVAVTGGRNYFNNVQFYGAMDAASAQGTGSRSLKVGSGGSGENVFNRCQIGQDTVTRTVANASLELAGATPRNSFIECIFPLQASADAPLIILGTGAGCLDRWNEFTRCKFINNIKSTSTAQSVAVSLTNAAPGGLLLLKDCDTVGFTKIGDTIALANTYVSNVGGAATGGLDLNPS